MVVSVITNARIFIFFRPFQNFTKWRGNLFGTFFSSKQAILNQNIFTFFTYFGVLEHIKYVAKYFPLFLKLLIFGVRFQWWKSNRRQIGIKFLQSVNFGPKLELDLLILHVLSSIKCPKQYKTNACWSDGVPKSLRQSTKSWFSPINSTFFH